MPRVLYLSYTGMTDSLGESQVLPYLAGLQKLGYHFTIISCEKPILYQQHKKRIQAYCKEANLVWLPLPYRKKPPVLSTILDYRNMLSKARQQHKLNAFNWVHCRGYIPALTGLQLKKAFKLPFIFDMRGFWPDEKKESGAWKHPIFQPIYTFFKRKERVFFQDSIRVVSLTEIGKKEIMAQQWAPEEKIGVIPTCVDFAKFPPFKEEIRLQVRKKLGISPSAKVLLYSGSLGGNYDLHIPFTIFKAFRKTYPESAFILLSRTNPKVVRAYMQEKDIAQNQVFIQSVPFPEVHAYLMAGDVGLIFYGKGYSNLGRSPTKLGEYWACGLPAVSLKHIGDVDYLLQKHPENGVLIDHFENSQIEEAIRQIPFETPKIMLRQQAKMYFSLEKGIRFYDQLYQTI